MVEFNTCNKNENDAKTPNSLANQTINDRIAGTKSIRDIVLIILCHIL